jgi:predicted permease
MESLLNDVRYAIRGLLKRPGFAAVVIITLALGIGANTTIFTLVNAILLAPLPVSHPEQLVLFDDSPNEGTTSGDPVTGQWRRFSYSAYRYFREHDRSFQELSAFRSGESRLSVRQTGATTGDTAQLAWGHLVSGNYFAVLGVSARQGRVLNNDDELPSARPVAVISDSYWKQKMNSDTELVGKNVLLNGTAFTIVGVMSPDFFGVRVRRAPDFWLPLSFQPQIEMRKSLLDDENSCWLNLLGRLKPGAKIAEAQASANVELSQFLTEQAGTKITDDRRRGIQNSFVRLVPGGRGLSALRVFYSQALLTLQIIVAMVLMIACANVGNLLLSHGAARRAEISLRNALGASRARLVRQLLTESLVLAIIGGVGGVLLAQWGVRLLVTRVAATAPLTVRPDLNVLLFTTGIAIFSGAFFGIAPAVYATRADLTSALKEKSSPGRRGRLKLGSLLVISQVAVSLILLVGAGLFARSLIKLQQEDLGFNRDNLLLVSIDAGLAGYKSAELNSVYRRLYDSLSALPNVRVATLASYSPMSGRSSTSSLNVQGYTPRIGEDMSVSDILIGPDYDQALGLPLLLGRGIGVQDTAGSTKVAVINQSLAQYFFHDQSPIGRRISFGQSPEKAEIEIVGVIGDAKYGSAKERADRAVYRPILQVEDKSTQPIVLHLRTTGDPMGVAGEVRAAIAQVDDKIPVVNVTSLRNQTDDALRQEKLLAQLMSFFGLLALVLACVGLYGIMAHEVVRRTNEIGIRMALGAARGDIVQMVLGEALTFVLAGLLIGIPIALAAGQLISNQLFGLKPSDPLSFVAAGVVLLAVSLLAAYLPARKASRVDPLVALRYE